MQMEIDQSRLADAISRASKPKLGNDRPTPVVRPVVLYRNRTV